MGWVDFDLDVPQFFPAAQPIQPCSHLPKQNYAVGRQWNDPNQCQPNPGDLPPAPPCTYNFSTPKKLNIFPRKVSNSLKFFGEIPTLILQLPPRPRLTEKPPGKPHPPPAQTYRPLMGPENKEDSVIFKVQTQLNICHVQISPHQLG